MGFNFDEAKKKLNLDETLDKVSKVVKDTVEQIDDAIEKGRETLSEKFEKHEDVPSGEPGPAPQPAEGASTQSTPGEGAAAGESGTPGEGAANQDEQGKPDYTI